jgi:phosphoglycolate phosphatase
VNFQLKPLLRHIHKLLNTVNRFCQPWSLEQVRELCHLVFMSKEQSLEIAQCRAIIFDLDGTLVDTLGDLQSSLNHALISQGRDPISLEQCRTYVGHGMRQLVHSALAGQPGSIKSTDQGGAQAKEIDTVLQRFLEYYRQHLMDFSQPYSGIPDLLAQIPPEFSLGVLSNKAEEMVKIIVKALFPSIPWRLVAGKREGYPHKPDPQSLLNICQVLDLDPSEVIYIGDSEVDCQTAHNAGCRPWAVSWGFRDREILEAANPERIFDSVGQLADALKL